MNRLDSTYQSWVTDLLNRSSRRTPCGAVLDVIANSPDLGEKAKAGYLHEQLGCKRGLGVLCRAVNAIRSDELGTNWDVRLRLFEAIAALDTQQSHAFLREAMTTTQDNLIQSDILTAFAFEDLQFEPLLVLKYIDSSQLTSLLESALYALLMRSYRAHDKSTLNQIRALLRHPSPFVRIYAVGILAISRGNKALIQRLLADADENVRAAAAQALNETL